MFLEYKNQMAAFSKIWAHCSQRKFAPKNKPKVHFQRREMRRKKKKKKMC